MDFHTEVADEVVVSRIAGRRIDPLSGKIYHVKAGGKIAPALGTYFWAFRTTRHHQKCKTG